LGLNGKLNLERCSVVRHQWEKGHFLDFIGMPFVYKYSLFFLLSLQKPSDHRVTICMNYANQTFATENPPEIGN
jgi:hypothetical protein